NSALTLTKCLESVANQSYNNFGAIEIITVDSFSTDSTQEIAKKFGSLYVFGPERTFQANLGARMSRGKYLYRIDSDWIIDTKLVEEAVSASEKFGLDAVAIHNTSD